MEGGGARAARQEPEQEQERVAGQGGSSEEARATIRTCNITGVRKMCVSRDRRTSTAAQDRTESVSHMAPHDYLAVSCPFRAVGIART